MRVESNIAAVVAALDLKLVRLIRDAMADGPGPGGIAGVHQPDPTIEPRHSVTPEPDIAPRRTVHPEPRFEPRAVIHPDPEVEPVPPLYAGPCESERAGRANSPVEPPWAVLPWEQPLPVTAPPPSRVKAARVRPDIAKGRLIDVMS